MTNDNQNLGKASTHSDGSAVDPNVTASEGTESQASRVVSPKELARELRREAYQRAKAHRAADPHYARMKEAAKQQRRELYQRVKEQRKAAASRAKATRVASRAEEQAQARGSVQRDLQQRLKVPARSDLGEERAGGGTESQAQTQAAPKSARVNALMQKLRLASEQPVIGAHEREVACEVIPLFRDRAARKDASD